jgi:hypothetical protein
MDLGLRGKAAVVHLEGGTCMPGIETNDIEPDIAEFMRQPWRPEPKHGAQVAAATNVLFDQSKPVGRGLHWQTDSQTG